MGSEMCIRDSFDPGANSGLPETACRPLLLALAHGSPSSSSPPWGHLMPPRPYRASSFNLGSSATTLPVPCGAPSASCGRGAGCCALLLAMAMATATGIPTPTPTPTTPAHAHASLNTTVIGCSLYVGVGYPVICEQT